MEIEKIINAISASYSMYLAAKQTITNVEKIRIANSVNSLVSIINDKINELVIPEHEPNKQYFISLRNDLNNYRVKTFLKHKFLLNKTLISFKEKKSKGFIFINMAESSEEINIDKEIEFVERIINFINKNLKKCEKYFGPKFWDDTKYELKAVSYGGGYLFDKQGNRYWKEAEGCLEF